MCSYPLPKILFTTPLVHGLPVRDGRPSALKASQTFLRYRLQTGSVTSTSVAQGCFSNLGNMPRRPPTSSHAASHSDAETRGSAFTVTRGSLPSRLLHLRRVAEVTLQQRPAWRT